MSHKFTQITACQLDAKPKWIKVYLFIHISRVLLFICHHWTYLGFLNTSATHRHTQFTLQCDHGLFNSTRAIRTIHILYMLYIFGLSGCSWTNTGVHQVSADNLALPCVHTQHAQYQCMHSHKPVRILHLFHSGHVCSVIIQKNLWK